MGHRSCAMHSQSRAAMLGGTLAGPPCQTCPMAKTLRPHVNLRLRNTVWRSERAATQPAGCPSAHFRCKTDRSSGHHQVTCCAANGDAGVDVQSHGNGSSFARIIVPTSLALMLCNMDRICMSIAILPMAAEFNWAPSVQGIVQSAFLWGYTLTQYLGGSLADRYGGKKVMAYGIVWFSVASLLLPVAVSPAVAAAGLTLPAVVAARAMVGLGEGVALPGMNNLVGSRIPQARRSTALGACFSGFHSGYLEIQDQLWKPSAPQCIYNLYRKKVTIALDSIDKDCPVKGNLVGLVLSPLILSAFGWRTLFLAFGVFGGPLLLLWQLVVPDQHQQQQQQQQQKDDRGQQSGLADAAPTAAALLRTQPSAAEVQAVADTQPSGGAATASTAPTADAVEQPSTPQQSATRAAVPAVGVLKLLSKTAVWAIVVANIVNHWGYFIFLFHMPSYFFKTLGLDLRTSAFLSLLPWAVMAIGSTSAGLLADGLIRRGTPVKAVRKRLQTVAFLGPAIALTALSQPGLSKTVAVALMTAALGVTSLGQAGFVANISDVAPNHAGKLFGLCNTFGSSAGIIGVTGVGFIVERTGSYTLVFQLTTALYIIGALVWNRFCETDIKFE